VHDTLDLEARGIPGVFVATTQFVEAAASQARSLGGEPSAVFVQHPIQDRTDPEIVAIADRAFHEIADALTARSWTSGRPRG